MNTIETQKNEKCDEKYKRMFADICEKAYRTIPEREIKKYQAVVLYPLGRDVLKLNNYVIHLCFFAEMGEDFVYKNVSELLYMYEEQ